MARVNITIPDDVLVHAKAAGLNVSRLATAAVRDELDRRAKIAALDTSLRELEAELGPVPEDQQRSARDWASHLLEEVERRTGSSVPTP
jgi:Post-segregation antitoxin CcdA